MDFNVPYESVNKTVYRIHSLYTMTYYEKNFLECTAWLCESYAGVSDRKGGHTPPQTLADQLTLSQPLTRRGGAD